jgi:hypothetical protein
MLQRCSDCLGRGGGIEATSWVTTPQDDLATDWASLTATQRQEFCSLNSDLLGDGLGDALITFVKDMGDTSMGQPTSNNI